MSLYYYLIGIVNMKLLFPLQKIHSVSLIDKSKTFGADDWKSPGEIWGIYLEKLPSWGEIVSCLCPQCFMWVVVFKMLQCFLFLN